MTEKQTKNNYPSLEKVLITAGLSLIVLGCVANTFGGITNIRFIRDVFDAVYYFRYDVLLVGGLVIGYLLSKKSTHHNKWFSGVVYAVLGVSLFELLDVLRFAFQIIFGNFPYPWVKILFDVQPLASLLIIIVIALTLHYKLRRPAVGMFVKVLSIVSLILYQGFILISGIYYLINGMGTYSSAIPIWLTVVEYLTTPLAVAVIAYIALSRVKKMLDRTFFATLIASFYSILTIVLWEFRTDPSLDATNIFSNVVLTLSIIFVVALLWRSRRAIK